MTGEVTAGPLQVNARNSRQRCPACYTPGMTRSSPTTAPLIVAKPRARSPRSWLWWSVRAVCTVVALVAIPSLFQLAHGHYAARQRQAVIDTVLAAGGSVAEETCCRWGNCTPRPYGFLDWAWGQVAWLAPPKVSLGRVWADRRFDVQTETIPLPGLSYCAGVCQVRLAGGMGTDDNVARLANCQFLNTLAVRGEATDRGLAPLARFEPMVVSLERSPPSDEIVHALPLPSMSLALRGIPVSADLLEQIGSRKRLVSLVLEKASLTDERLLLLTSLGDLKFLSLAENSIHGPALEILPRFPRLELLDLRGTAIDDAALIQVARHPQLRRVFLPRGRSPAALQKLRTARPNLEIEVGEPPWALDDRRDDYVLPQPK